MFWGAFKAVFGIFAAFILIAALFFGCMAAAIAQQPAFLVAQYVNGQTRTCEYSDGTRYDMHVSQRCPAVMR